MFTSQNAELKDYLEKHESITQLEALRELGIMRLSARIANLREAGVPIKSEIIAVSARNGRKAHIARYSIIREA